MNKEKYIKQSEDAVIVGKIFDKIQDVTYPDFTRFLTPYERLIARNICNDHGVKYRIYGGYEGSERCILGVFPDYVYDVMEEEYPINCIKIEATQNKFLRELTHRDYLGALLGLNIKREMIGDIIPYDKGAYVFVYESITDFLLLNLKQIGRSSVECSVHTGEIDLGNQDKEEMIITVASNRLDCILCAITDLSRDKAKNLINGLYVAVNYEPCKNSEKSLKAGDVFSARGYGKFEFVEVMGETRKKKLRIKIEKYL